MPEKESPQTAIDVQHLATLARLSLAVDGAADGDAADQAASQVAVDLQNIIAMVDAMQAVDTTGIEPMAHPLDATQRLREDVVTEHVDPSHFQAHAPETQDNFYLVPRVVE